MYGAPAPRMVKDNKKVPFFSCSTMRAEDKKIEEEVVVVDIVSPLTSLQISLIFV
jgi:hypothetical protein